MLNHEESIKDHSAHQGKSGRNSKIEMPHHDYESSRGNGPKTASTAATGLKEEVITLSDQIVIPEFSAMHLNDLSAQKMEGLGSLLPPSMAIGRKRFNSSMLDLKKLSQRERFESGSNISTNISNRSDFEFDRIERQKKREQEVLQKIQKIWTQMEDVKREISYQYPIDEQES